MPPRKRRFVKLPFFVHGLFCETVREEKTGSSSYIGVFPDNIDVPSLPGMITQLAAVLWISMPVQASVPAAVTMTLELPESPAIPPIPLALPGAPPAAPGTLRRVITAKLQFGVVSIPAAGKVRIILEIDGKSYLGPTLNIRLAAPPSSSDDSKVN